MSNFEGFISSLSPEQLQQLREALNNTGDKPTPKIEPKQLPSRNETKREEVVSSRSPRRKVNEDFTVVRNEDSLDQRKAPVKAKKNQWMDTGEDRDPDFDPAKFERMGKVARNRQKTKKEDVECHVCGRTFQVNPSLVYGEFVRCNRCTGR